MAIYRATTDWRLKDGEDFAKGRYSRGHAVVFGSGQEVAGTASAHVIGNKWAVAGAVDPEEMLVASLSACHMLSFLYIAAKAGFTVSGYRDEAEGLMGPDAESRTAITRVTLRPRIAYEGRAPTPDESAHLHHQAHEECFIANSVKTAVAVEEAAP